MNVDYTFNLDLSKVEKESIPKMQDLLDSGVIHYLRLNMPRRNGLMAQETKQEKPGEVIVGTEYARYQNGGKLYVDPKYGKGAFYSSNYGYWSRPEVKKIPTNRNLKHKTGQSRFVEKTLIADKPKIIEWVIRGMK